VLLARGLSLSPDTLRAVLLGKTRIGETVRPVELDEALWQRLEQSALGNRRIIRTPDGQVADINSELAALLDKHLPQLKRKAS
jgi:hypothetical protein